MATTLTSQIALKISAGQTKSAPGSSSGPGPSPSAGIHSSNLNRFLKQDMFDDATIHGRVQNRPENRPGSNDRVGVYITRADASCLEHTYSRVPTARHDEPQTKDIENIYSGDANGSNRDGDEVLVQSFDANGVKTYICPECKRFYAGRDALNRHYSTRHKRKGRLHWERHPQRGQPPPITDNQPPIVSHPGYKRSGNEGTKKARERKHQGQLRASEEDDPKPKPAPKGYHPGGRPTGDMRNRTGYRGVIKEEGLGTDDRLVQPESVGNEASRVVQSPLEKSKARFGTSIRSMAEGAKGSPSLTPTISVMTSPSPDLPSGDSDMSGSFWFDDVLLDESREFVSAEQAAVSKVVNAYQAWSSLVSVCNATCLASVPTDTPGPSRPDIAPSDSSGVNSSQFSSTSQPAFPPGQRTRRRRRQEDDDPEEFKKPPVPKRKRVEKGARRLACPFQKRYPRQHFLCGTGSPERGFDTIAHIKDHLKRRHIRHPLYCPRCKTRFDDLDERDKHIVSAMNTHSCDEQPFPDVTQLPWKQSLADAMKQKVDRTLNLHEQWFSLWSIIFPDIDPPSSCLVDDDICEHVSDFRDFFTTQGREVVREVIRAQGLLPETDDQEPEGLQTTAQLTAFAESVCELSAEALFRRWVSQRPPSSVHRHQQQCAPPSMPALNQQGIGLTSAVTLEFEVQMHQAAPVTPDAMRQGQRVPTILSQPLLDSSHPQPLPTCLPSSVTAIDAHVIQQDAAVLIENPGLDGGASAGSESLRNGHGSSGLTDNIANDPYGLDNPYFLSTMLGMDESSFVP